MKLSLKLLAGYFLIVGIAGFFVLRIFVAEVKPSVRVTIEESMVDMANVLAEFAAIELVAAPSTRLSEGAFAHAVKEFSRRPVQAQIHHHAKDALDLRIYATDQRGIVIFDSSGKDVGKDYSAWRDVKLTLRGEYGARSTREILGDDTTAVYHVAAPIKHRSDIIGVLTVAKPIRSVSPIIDEAERNIVNKGLWLVLSSLLIGLWVSSRLQQSVTRLVNYAHAVAQGKVASKPSSSTRELQQLADAMANMRSELDGKMYVERYVQALTHELKSPLTALHAHAELLTQMPADTDVKHSANRVLEQAERIRHLVDQMLVLSRLEGGGHLALTRINWSELLSAVVSSHLHRAQDKGLTLTLNTPEGSAWVQADANLLLLACSNLVQNALDFSPSGSTVHCSLKRTSSEWEFTVRDHGPGLSELAHIKLFERYFSTPRPGNGARSSGLGLALAKEIVHAHKGTISLSNMEPGCSACICLPAR